MATAHELNAGDVIIHNNSMKIVHSIRATRHANVGYVVVTWSDRSSDAIPANVDLPRLYPLTSEPT